MTNQSQMVVCKYMLTLFTMADAAPSFILSTKLQETMISKLGRAVAASGTHPDPPEETADQRLARLEARVAVLEAKLARACPPEPPWMAQEVDARVYRVNPNREGIPFHGIERSPRGTAEDYHAGIVQLRDIMEEQWKPESARPEMAQIEARDMAQAKAEGPAALAAWRAKTFPPGVPPGTDGGDAQLPE